MCLGRPASQTHIPTRNRYLVSSRGLKVQVSVWGHRHYPFVGSLEPPPSFLGCLRSHCRTSGYRKPSECFPSQALTHIATLPFPRALNHLAQR